MALAMLAEIPRLTRQQYESVAATINRAGTPAGALFHAGGPSDSGYRVVEVWQNREAAEAFYGSELYRQAVVAADLVAEPEIVMTWTVEGMDDGHGWRALA
jgi:quinol monooxygenase YgiN